MPVNTPRSEYSANLDRWQRARAAADGSDAVKAMGQRVLPYLDSHKSEMGGVIGVTAGVGGPATNMNYGASGPQSKYDEYKLRATYYNATGRTVAGLVGAVMQKEPKLDKVPSAVKDHLEDVTLTGVSLSLFASEILHDVLLVGRYGILVDMPAGEQADARPYWAPYEAENILSWETDRVDGFTILTRVVLRENDVKRDLRDPFAYAVVTSYRVLELVDGVYNVTVWAPAGPQNSALVPGETVTPKRRGEPLPYIPFTFCGPCTTSGDVEKAPLLDLVDVNLSHYRTMADLAHGLHFTALPTPWVSGATAGTEEGPQSIGAGVMLVLGQGGQAGMLEFSGAGLGSLRTDEQEKRKMMATLGARLIEDSPVSAETATSFLGRHSGEQASLRTVVNAVEHALTTTLRWHAWWSGIGGDDPRDIDLAVQLNKDFFNVKMTSAELQVWITALQAGAVAYETFYAQLEAGEMTRPGVDAEEEQADIEAFNAPADSGVMGQPELQPGPGGPGVGPGDQVIQDTGPYKLLKRKSKFVVITADTGKVHGTFPTREMALKQLAALEIALKKEKK